MLPVGFAKHLSQGTVVYIKSQFYVQESYIVVSQYMFCRSNTLLMNLSLIMQIQGNGEKELYSISEDSLHRHSPTYVKWHWVLPDGLDSPLCFFIYPWVWMHTLQQWSFSISGIFCTLTSVLFLLHTSPSLAMKAWPSLLM